jgi:hypothetical protein
LGHEEMVYSAGSTPMSFQLPPEQTANWGRAEWGEPSANNHKQAEAVAAINLSHGTWKYDLKTLPRPKGKETQVIYTTWELPVTMRPHDTRIGLDGAIWFNHFDDNCTWQARPEDRAGQSMAMALQSKAGIVRAHRRAHDDGTRQAGQVLYRQSGAKWRRGFRSGHEKFEFHDPPGGGEMMDVSASQVERDRLALRRRGCISN